MQQVKIVISHEFCWLKKLVSHVGLQISASDWFQLHQGSGGAKYFRSIGLKFFLLGVTFYTILSISELRDSKKRTVS